MECCQGRFCTKKSVALAAFQGHPIGLGHRPGVHPQDPRGRVQREAVHVRAAGRQDEVTKRFDSDKVVNVVDVTVHAVLDDGSHGTVVAVQRISSSPSNPVHEHFAGGTLELLTGLRHQHPFDSVAPKLREGRLHEVIDPTLLTGKQLPAPNEEVRKMFELAVMYMLSAQNGLCMLGVAK
ncbi:Os04g0581283 [Oryza sativa Japonica Group]|uniref:Os04g0581283 protein n=1 Tax=Oryza sativa subsp. japonica TaxID=39947 RepID=A0A0P0WDW3_ORYSJ|nr:Os04g0581283 [Oryza sativa Japonica Group]